MTLRIPAGTPAGLAKFWWQLGTPTEPLHGGGVSITR
jgi:hypothetical protein